MNRIFLITIALAASGCATSGVRAPSSSRDGGDLVATCTNHEATYLFYGSDSRIQYVQQRGMSAANGRFDCEASRRRGEEVNCKVPYESNMVTLYADGYAIMHYNMDSDSNNDGQKAYCTGTYFRR